MKYLCSQQDITQFVEVLEEEDKFLRLLQLLGTYILPYIVHTHTYNVHIHSGLWYERGSVLIFVDKQEKCDQLFQDLLKFSYPVRCHMTDNQSLTDY